jgi:hypothetical protein
MIKTMAALFDCSSQHCSAYRGRGAFSLIFSLPTAASYMAPLADR